MITINLSVNSKYTIIHTIFSICLVGLCYLFKVKLAKVKNKYTHCMPHIIYSRRPQIKIPEIPIQLSAQLLYWYWAELILLKLSRACQLNECCLCMSSFFLICFNIWFRYTVSSTVSLVHQLLDVRIPIVFIWKTTIFLLTSLVPGSMSILNEYKAEK